MAESSQLIVTSRCKQKQDERRWIRILFTKTAHHPNSGAGTLEMSEKRVKGEWKIVSIKSFIITVVIFVSLFPVLELKCEKWYRKRAPFDSDALANNSSFKPTQRDNKKSKQTDTHRHIYSTPRYHKFIAKKRYNEEIAMSLANHRCTMLICFLFVSLYLFLIVFFFSLYYFPPISFLLLTIAFSPSTCASPSLSLILPFTLPLPHIHSLTLSISFPPPSFLPPSLPPLFSPKTSPQPHPLFIYI